MRRKRPASKREAAPGESPKFAAPRQQAYVRLVALFVLGIVLGWWSSSTKRTKARARRVVASSDNHLATLSPTQPDYASVDLSLPRPKYCSRASPPPKTVVVCVADSNEAVDAHLSLPLSYEYAVVAALNADSVKVDSANECAAAVRSLNRTYHRAVITSATLAWLTVHPPMSKLNKNEVWKRQTKHQTAVHLVLPVGKLLASPDVTALERKAKSFPNTAFVATCGDAECPVESITIPKMAEFKIVGARKEYRAEVNAAFRNWMTCQAW